MSNKYLFQKCGFLRAPFAIGVGRYVCQLQRVTIKFCKSHGASLGVRNFIEYDLINYAKENPGVVVYVKPRRHKHPILKAEYLNGETHWMSIANYSREDIIQWMELLKTQYHNGPDYRLFKLWHTDFPSIQGPWTPFTFKEPSLNQIQFPNKKFGECIKLEPIQDGVLHSMELLQKEALNGPDNLRTMIVLIFLQLLNFSKLACEAPTYGKIPTKHISQIRGVSTDWVTMNYVPFGEKALSMIVTLYQKTAHEMAVIEGQVLKHIIEALHVPLSMKYACPSPTTWKLAVTSLLAVLHTGLPLARKYSEQFQSMWPELASTLDDFLFPKSVLNVERGVEEIQADEAVDCQVMELLRDEVLPHSQHIPHQFILRVVMLLNKGSIHSATTTNIENSGETKLREEFAKTCFETLLQFSLLDGLNSESDHDTTKNSENDEGGVAGRLAVTALLHRFQEVLRRYIENERRSGKCPLPRYRLSEISFVLKAVATLVISLKKAPPNKVERSVWEQLIGLYPCLVECTIATASGQVSRSLREALLQYHDLLKPPLHSSTASNGV